MAPGVPTTEHWRVGLLHRLYFTSTVGVCVSVTPWGNDRVRWVRLRFPDGTAKSYPPSALKIVEP